MVHIDRDRCTGCGACVEVCPPGALQLVEDITGRYAEVDRALCRECQACMEVCPEEAIQQVGAEPVMEGELVPVEPRAVQVDVGLQEARPARAALRALAWLGPALAYVGREIVPRVASLLLEAWDRRTSSPASTLSVPDNSLSVPPSQPLTPGVNQRRLSGLGGRQYRWRRGRGR